MFIEHTVTKGTKVNRSNNTKTESSRREYPLTEEQVALFTHLRDREAKEELSKELGNLFPLKKY